MAGFNWSGATDAERQAYAEAKARRECAEQGIPFESSPAQSAVVARIAAAAAETARIAERGAA